MTLRDPIDLGGVTVQMVSGGINQTDGGGMNGILPRLVWEKWYPPDEENRIRVDNNCLVVQSEAGRVLIETGTGNKLSEKELWFFGAQPEDWIGANLEAAGFPPSSFDLVVVTHLHTDHAGGLVTLSPEGELIPTFPNAQVVVGESEYADAEAGYGIGPNAYSKKNYQVLLESGQMRRIPDDSVIAPHLRYLSTPGHTRGHQSVLVEGSEKTLLFTGDIFPLFSHSVLHHNMAYDVAPVEKMATKRWVLERAAREDWLLLLSHEPNTPLCRAVYQESKGRFELVPID
jgi:glyoxylase-like metal-dependent hydrolase (beta-lactamase superfamily II)